MALTLIPGVYINAETGLKAYGYRNEIGKDLVGELLDNTLNIVELSVSIQGDVVVRDADGTDFNGGPLVLALDGSCYVEAVFDTDRYVAVNAHAFLATVKASQGEKLVAQDDLATVVVADTITITPAMGKSDGNYKVGVQAYGNVESYGTLTGTIGGATLHTCEVDLRGPTHGVSMHFRDDVLPSYAIQLTNTTDEFGQQYILNTHGGLEGIAANNHFTAIDDVLLDSGRKLHDLFRKAEVTGDTLSFDAIVVPFPTVD